MFVRVLGLIILVVVGILGYLFSGGGFEKEMPKMIPIVDGEELPLGEESLNDFDVFWNGSSEIAFRLSDNRGLKYLKIFEKDGEGRLVFQKVFNGEKNVTTPITLPKEADLNAILNANRKPEVTSRDFRFELADMSNINFGSGNVLRGNFRLVLDRVNPKISIITHSYSITQGGSALVIFRVEDENLKNIQLNNGKDIFTPQPFYANGYYISLVAWPLFNEKFNLRINAKDWSNNQASLNVPFFQIKRKYKESTIELTDNFIDGKISSLVLDIGERDLSSFSSKLDIFKYINDDVRNKAIYAIWRVSSIVDFKTPINSFYLSPFLPLPRSAAVASFGDHRVFVYKGQPVSESYHMGLDLASTKEAPVFLSNPGAVIYNGFLGIYGNVVVLDHGLGFSTLYAHLTSSNVNFGNFLQKGQIIGHTGATGLALGDHLHFSTLVQGYEVRTAEWMDAGWIKRNITDVIEDAKGQIDKIILKESNTKPLKVGLQ